MKSRATIISIAVLLCLSLVATVFAALTAVQAVHSFEQQHALARAGDVRSIRPWMTVPYVAHTYHVPESYLYQSLHISNQRPPRHVPLHTLAIHSRRPVSEIIHNVQTAILAYRKQHKHTHTYTGISYPHKVRRSV